MSLSPEQILALAPDPASAKAGSAQASASYWSGLGTNAQAMWGLCQGSGKEPYRTQIELAGPAFKCSCPSRKFPCKHGLGLYLLFAKQPAMFGTYEPPEWVSEWLQSREHRSEKKAAKAEEAAQQQAALSPEQLAARELAQQKRQDKRAQNVAQGIELLDTWLQDLAREGLAGLKSKPASGWEAMAARMVDAQAPGLANRIRKASILAYGNSGPHWEIPVARELAQLALISQCHARLGQLAAPLQADIRSAIGWVTAQEEALAQAPLADRWQVCGSQTVQDERISRRTIYLRGQNTGRWGMLLQFAAGGQTLPAPMLPASHYQGSLHFYPSATPLRALFGDDVQADAAPMPQLQTAEMPDSVSHSQQNPQHAPATSMPHVKADENRVAGQAKVDPFESALQEYASLLGMNPLLDTWPMLLPGVIPQVQPASVTSAASAFALRTGDGNIVPIAPEFPQGWLLLALTGGQAATVFGLWNGVNLLPLTLSTPERVHSFDTELT